MTSVADYVGRTTDLMAFQGVSEEGEVLLSQDLVTDTRGGLLCTGAQKMAQQWLMEFLTEIGTVLYLPDKGCDFMSLVRQGQLRSTLDAQQAFATANQQAQRNMANDVKASTPDDEILALVELLDVAVDGDTLKLYVRLTSRAADAAPLILPISVRTS